MKKLLLLLKFIITIIIIIPLGLLRVIGYLLKELSQGILGILDAIDEWAEKHDLWKGPR